MVKIGGLISTMGISGFILRNHPLLATALLASGIVLAVFDKSDLGLLNIYVGSSALVLKNPWIAASALVTGLSLTALGWVILLEEGITMSRTLSQRLVTWFNP